MIKELNNAKEIFIYHKGCYGCGGTANLYNSLQSYILDTMINKLPKYQIRRIDYDIKWQDELKSADLSAPAVKIINSDNQVFWIAYQELEKKLSKDKNAKEETRRKK